MGQLVNRGRGRPKRVTRAALAQSRMLTWLLHRFLGADYSKHLPVDDSATKMLCHTRPLSSFQHPSSLSLSQVVTQSAARYHPPHPTSATSLPRSRATQKTVISYAQVSQRETHHGDTMMVSNHPRESLERADGVGKRDHLLELVKAAAAGGTVLLLCGLFLQSAHHPTAAMGPGI